MGSDVSVRPFIQGIIVMMFSAFFIGLAVGTTFMSNEYISMTLLSVSAILTLVSLRMIKPYANRLTLKE